jgi:hypothetical protein
VATTEEPRLPTEAEYDAAEKALQTAFDEVERVVWMIRDSLRHKDGESPLDDEPAAIGTVVVPTLNDIGRAYSFVTDLDSQVEQLAQKRKRAQYLLRILDEARLNAAVRAGVA